MESRQRVRERRQGIAGGGSWWVGTPLAALRCGFAGPWRARALAAKLAAPEGSAQTLAASQWFKRTSLRAVARSAHARAAQPPHKSLPAGNPLPPSGAAVRGLVPLSLRLDPQAVGPYTRRTTPRCHSRAGGNPRRPGSDAQALGPGLRGDDSRRSNREWRSCRRGLVIPAFAGMTGLGGVTDKARCDQRAQRPKARRSRTLLARGRRCLAGAISVALEASRLERARASAPRDLTSGSLSERNRR